MRRGETSVVTMGCAVFAFGVLAISLVAGIWSSTHSSNESTPVAAPAAPRGDPLLKPLNVVIRNQYAESLFTLDVTVVGKKVDGGTAPMGKKVRVFERERVRGHDSTRRDRLFTMPRSAETKINLAATSLGEERYFSVKVEPDPAGDTLQITYDWDVATAAFTINYGWR